MNLHLLILNAVDRFHSFGIRSGSIHKVGRGLGKTPLARNCDNGVVTVTS